MERKVLIKDYEEDKHLMLVALQAVGFQIDYKAVDLINDTLEVLKNKGGKMDIKDSVKIKHQHEKKWDNYFKNLSDEAKKES